MFSLPKPRNLIHPGRGTSPIHCRATMVRPPRPAHKSKARKKGLSSSICLSAQSSPRDRLPAGEPKVACGACYTKSVVISRARLLTREILRQVHIGSQDAGGLLEQLASVRAWAKSQQPIPEGIRPTSQKQQPQQSWMRHAGSSKAVGRGAKRASVSGNAGMIYPANSESSGPEEDGTHPVIDFIVKGMVSPEDKRGRLQRDRRDHKEIRERVRLAPGCRRS